MKANFPCFLQGGDDGNLARRCWRARSYSGASSRRSGLVASMPMMAPQPSWVMICMKSR